MQPLEVAFMASLSNYYSQEVRKWLQCHPGRVITITQVAGLYGTAFMIAASTETAVNAFRKSGIFPLDADIFPDWMYQPAETTDTDSPLEKGDVPTSEPTSESLNRETSFPSTPGCSQSDRPKPSTSAFHVSRKDIKSVPVAERKGQKSDRRRGTKAVLTSSPYKEELKSSMKKGKTPKRKLQMGPHSNSSRPTEVRNVGRRKQRKVQECSISSEGEGEDNNPACIYCNELFSSSKSEEG